MRNLQTADIDHFLAAILAGEIQLAPTEGHAGQDPWSALREPFGRIPAQPEPPPMLGQAVLRVDPERILQRLQAKWAAGYDRYLTRLLTGGPDIWIETDPLPDDLPVDEDALYASLAAHDRWEAWRNAVAEGDIDRLQCAYTEDPADFAGAFSQLLQVAIERDQREALRYLLKLARTPRRAADFDRLQLLDTALALAAMYRQEPILAVLLDEEAADPFRFDAAFWRFHFPRGPADPKLREILIDRVPGFGVALLRQAAAAQDWEQVRVLADRLDVGALAAQSEETQRALAFLERLRFANTRPSSTEVLHCLIGVWRHVAAGHPLKTMAADLGRSISQLSRHRRHLEQRYREIYGPPGRFGPLEASRVWEALRGQPIYEAYRARREDREPPNRPG